jgi:membrane protein
MVLGIGFLMLVSLGFSAVLSGLNAYLENRFSGSSLLHKLLNEVLSFVIFASLFAAIFKYLPDAIISWRDVWIGAVATAVLFMAGKLAIGIYLGHSSVASMYGAAGSIVAWLVWVYYSSLLLLVGAEFTQVHARRSGMGIRPSKHAIRAKSHSK